MFGLREGLFECCNPMSSGEPEFLLQDHHISNRAAANLMDSASGNLKLYFQSWRSDRHEFVRAAVMVHHGENEHCGWFNGLAVRLANIGCATFVLDAQGFGQSDGARGYFEAFEDLVADYVEFCKQKWNQVAREQAKASKSAPLPGLVLLGKGFGALVVMRALIELHPLAASWGVTPSVVLISPAFQFANFIGDQSNVSCGLNSQQCARQPTAQCARVPASVAFNPTGGEGPHQKLEHTSRWFPKMIVTEPVDPDMVSRDPQTVDRMNRDILCWRQGYRSRVLAEIVSEQATIAEAFAEHPEVFERAPALVLHGSGDKLFAVAGSHGMHSMWCDAAQRTGIYPRLKIYDGAFHQLLQEPNKDEVSSDILLFIASKAVN
eukprot:TRINITY_DN62799_c0_g1_i1.p1 TRINITY_DN62799_c0_g1~~TRINITY_DN62799_c0_g1_i1.p1  ORF type:complete len:378 (+),score=61.91 TRINITY_DN62799_c0_g1_i1:154-1287(+)